MMDAQIMHFRKKNGNPRGGLTIAIGLSQDNELMITQAKCSDDDMFNRKVGFNIAVGRLMAWNEGRSGLSLERNILANIPEAEHRALGPKSYKAIAVKTLADYLKRRKLVY